MKVRWWTIYLPCMIIHWDIGMFRKTCEVTLSVLRHNKIQLLSVFETLLYDPIVEWKRSKQSIQVRRMTGSYQTLYSYTGDLLLQLGGSKKEYERDQPKDQRCWRQGIPWHEHQRTSANAYHRGFWQYQACPDVCWYVHILFSKSWWIADTHFHLIGWAPFI